jgi:predicted RNA polymerase sigma factor
VTTEEQHAGADFASVAHARMDALEARRELAGIIDQLAAKADVKARLGRQFQAHKREITLAGVAAGLIAAGIGLLLWRRR